jgi:hypothetical protein
MEKKFPPSRSEMQMHTLTQPSAIKHRLRRSAGLLAMVLPAGCGGRGGGSGSSANAGAATTRTSSAASA